MGVAIITVVDDRHLAADTQPPTKVVRCDIQLLLGSMRRLAADLQDVPAGQDVEVSNKQSCTTSSSPQHAGVAVVTPTSALHHTTTDHSQVQCGHV